MTKPVKFDAHIQARKAWVEVWLDERTEKAGAHALWQLAMTRDGKPRTTVFQEKALNIRRMVFSALHGRNIKPGHQIVPVCGDPACMSCLREMTQAGRIGLQFEQGKYGTTTAQAKRVATNRAKASFSLERARELRAMRAQGLTYEVIAGRMGISLSGAQKIGAGELWRETAPNASVFSWRPAA
jgi:hypothetical protein